MSFEDRLRTMFKGIDERVDREGLDWNATLARARRSRRIYLGSVAAGTALLVAFGAVGARAVLQLGEQERMSGPTSTSSPSTTPDPTSTSSGAQDCSAARDDSSIGFEPGAGSPEPLPPAVEETIEAIVEAARACDYEELERIAFEGDAGFNYSFGGGEKPARYWSQLEKGQGLEHREGVTAIMVTLLTLRPSVECMSASIGCSPGEEDLYLWPRAFGPEGTDGGAQSDEVWQELVDAGLYSREEVDQMRASGTGYTGYRIGILDDGDWIFFIGGD